MARPSHIFIVGSFRSGTTLLRQTLSLSEEIAISGETHFLGHFFAKGYRHKLAKLGDLSTDTGVHRIVDSIYNDKHDGFWRWVTMDVGREQFLKELLASDRTDRSLFDLVMKFHAKGKPIRGEKTPAHIYHIPTLMDWFPNAKVIHTLRDPRAIFVSENIKKLKTKEDMVGVYRFLSYSSLILKFYVSMHVLISWLWIVRLHKQYQRDYPDRYYLLRYEDLIRQPSESLHKICDFLEVDFNEKMLEQNVINSSFTAQQKGRPGFDTTAIDRWRNYLSPGLNKWFIFWCKKHLLEFGYQL